MKTPLPFPVITIGGPRDPAVLRARVVDREINMEELHRIGPRVVLTCERNAADGIAANQIGIYEPWFYMNTIHHRQVYRCFVCYPIITSYRGRKIPHKELSLAEPDRVWAVERHTIIDVAFMTLEGDQKQKTLEDYPAHVFQHLYDQLCGILPSDTGVPCQ